MIKAYCYAIRKKLLDKTNIKATIIVWNRREEIIRTIHFTFNTPIFYTTELSLFILKKVWNRLKKDEMK